MSVQEAIDFFDALLNSSFHPVNEDLYDEDNYFIPGIYNPFNISHRRGLNQGVLNHYAKDSFVIPDIKMNLSFSHFYSTTMVEMPNGFYQIKPLGTGWSHTYNSYITFENNVGNNNDDYYFIVWPDGTIHIYDENDEEYVSLGVYDELDELSGDRIRITKKDQTRFYYEQLDNERDIWYLVEIRDTNGNSIDIEYENAEEDFTMRIEYAEAPSGKRLNFFYENGYDFLESITDPIGRVLEFDVDGNNDQRLEEFTDAKGNETDYDYVENDENAPLADQRKRFLLEEITLPRGNKITAEFDNNNAKLESYQIDGDDPIEIDVDFDYPDEEEVTVTSPIDGGGDFVEEYEFNINGVVTSYDSPVDELDIDYPSSGPNVLLPDNSNLNGVSIEYDYDSNGNVTRIDKENGSIVEEFDYDSDNNLKEYIDPEGNITQYNYDNNENLTSIIDPLGNSSSFTYDSFGQLLSTTNQEGITVNYSYESDGALATIDAPENISSSFSYDGVNRLLTRNDNGLISTFEYDLNDNRTLFTNSGGFTTSYDYDANDNLVEILNANGVATSFEYDDEDRVIEEEFGNLTKTYEYNDEGFLESMTKPSGQTIEYEYDDEGRIEETGTITDMDYNARNLVESISNDTGTIEFDYDDLNRVEEVTTVFGYQVEYSYEDTNQIDEIEYPTINGIEVEVDISYDDKNRVFQVILSKNIGQQNVVIAEYDYLDDDRVEEIEFGNDTRCDYGYDDAGRLDYVEHFKVGAPTSFYIANHTLDNRGNVTQSNELVTPFPPDAIEYGFSSENVNYGYNQNNHITNANSIDYDVNDDGNTESASGDFNADYDIDDRLTDYNDLDNNIDFEYNPYNQRVVATIDGITTRFVRDVLNDNILVELNQNNNPIYYYIYHPDGMLLARMNANGELQYYHGDIRGSVVAMTNENGDITHQYRYEDFGWITKSSEPTNDTNRFRYVGTYGVEYDKHDLYYMRARSYRPSIGRFLTEDPVWHTNLYPYADNNPIVKTDPLGEDSIFSMPALSNYFYNNGYGDAANHLSQESAAWDFALNNPEVSGFIIGLGVGLSSASFAKGIIYGIASANGAGSVGSQYLISTSVKSLLYLNSASSKGKYGEQLFLYLGKWEDNNYQSLQGVFNNK